MNKISTKMNSYSLKLTDKIISILDDGPATLCNIIKSADGAYPQDVLSVLSALVEDDKLKYVNDYYALISSSTSLATAPIQNIVKSEHNQISQIVSGLSKPHPADYDWRFTYETIDDLIKILGQYTQGTTNLALFGVTTLFPIVQEFCKDIHVDLYNKSHSLISDLKYMGFNDGLYQQDLFNPIENCKRYHVIIADPPWYEDFYKAFILRASEVLEKDGYLLLSVLPELTRPEAKEDRLFIKQYCESIGLEEIEARPGFLNYESPAFEENALFNLGISCPNWRRGDLVTYKFVGDKKKGNVARPPADEPIWHEYIIKGVKVKILNNNENNDTFTFEYVDDTPILSSVSRRSPLRNRINFWTSDNVALKVSNLKVLQSFLIRLSTGIKVEEAIEGMKIQDELTHEESRHLISLTKIANIYT